MNAPATEDARRLSHEALEVLRLRAIAALGRGCSVSEIAKTYGLHRRTVFRWQATYAHAGEQGLRARPIPGRPKRPTS